jgi:hypothetical protein
MKSMLRIQKGSTAKIALAKVISFDNHKGVMGHSERGAQGYFTQHQEATGYFVPTQCNYDVQSNLIQTIQRANCLYSMFIFKIRSNKSNYSTVRWKKPQKRRNTNKHSINERPMPLKR